MNKKITLFIDSRKFDMDIDVEFATFLENSMSKDFNIDGNNDLKKVLLAYVRKTHELYIQEKEVEKILKNIEEKDKF